MICSTLRLEGWEIVDINDLQLKPPTIAATACMGIAMPWQVHMARDDIKTKEAQPKQRPQLPSDACQDLGVLLQEALQIDAAPALG